MLLALLVSQFGVGSVRADAGGDPHSMACATAVTAGSHAMAGADAIDTLGITNAAIGPSVAIAYPLTIGDTNPG